ncbi:MAG TPA: GGIII-like transmembrane region-containing protein [Bryobacteraceae bacterium]
MIALIQATPDAPASQEPNTTPVRIGALVLLVIIIAIIIMRRKKKKKKLEEDF